VFRGTMAGSSSINASSPRGNRCGPIPLSASVSSPRLPAQTLQLLHLSRKEEAAGTLPTPPALIQSGLCASPHAVGTRSGYEATEPPARCARKGRLPSASSWAQRHGSRWRTLRDGPASKELDHGRPAGGSGAVPRAGYAGQGWGCFGARRRCAKFLLPRPARTVDEFDFEERLPAALD